MDRMVHEGGMWYFGMKEGMINYFKAEEIKSTDGYIQAWHLIAVGQRLTDLGAVFGAAEPLLLRVSMYDVIAPLCPDKAEEIETELKRSFGEKTVETATPAQLDAIDKAKKAGKLFVIN